MSPCVVIPVYNEERELGRLVAAIRCQGLDVLVIDDGSTDQSGAAARSQGAVVLRHPTRRGKGFALQEGFQYVLEHDYPGVITMDGDGQHAPEDLPVFLSRIAQCPEGIITGSRMGDTRGMPRIRLWTNQLMSWLISRLCGQGIPDSQCGYRYISRDVLARMSLTAKAFEIETEVLLQASRLGAPVYSVPIQTIYREERSKINPIKDTLRFFWYLLRAGRGHRRGCGRGKNKAV